MYLQSNFLVLILAAVIKASPIHNRDSISTANTPQCPDYCTGTAPNQTLIHTYICGDARLGPKRYPTRLPLGSELSTYSPFGSLCPGEFLSKYYNETAKSYIYPPDEGFQLDVQGRGIEGNVTLETGVLLDRFGSEFGRFASPYGAPYMQRALPPSNLDTSASSPGYPYNYHVYKVEKSFIVLSGPIAAWFEQPGQGVQYDMPSNILTLINGGFLSRVTLDRSA